MAPACDFVPTLCHALAIQGCINKQECKLPELNLPGLELAISGGLDGVAEINLEIQAFDACLLAGLIQAFLTAGLTFPTLPTQDDLPDFEECKQQIEDLKNAADDPLSALGGVISVEFDETGLPTRIFNA